jgi:hypothetical protein
MRLDISFIAGYLHASRIAQLGLDARSTGIAGQFCESHEKEVRAAIAFVDARRAEATS